MWLVQLKGSGFILPSSYHGYLHYLVAHNLRLPDYISLMGKQSSSLTMNIKAPDTCFLTFLWLEGGHMV